MRRAALGLLVCLVALAATGDVGTAQAAGFELRTSRITVRFDSRMQRQLEWRGADGKTIVASDAAVQAGVRVAGRDLTEFRLDAGQSVQRRIVDRELGPGLEGALVGSLAALASLDDKAAGLAIVRRTRVFLPDAFPDTVIVQTTYRNVGKQRIQLERVYSERLLLDRKLAEPKAAAWDLASFQGGAYRWSRDYELIRLEKGFRQLNYMGQDDVKGPEGTGGGMPFIDVWGPTMGVALAHIQKRPEWVSFPVEVRAADDRVEIGLVETPQSKYGQMEWLAPGDFYETVTSALMFHRLDYHDPLRTYGDLLRLRGVAIPRTSPASAHEPYWKSWGFEKDFTIDQLLALLPELKAMGILTANLDDGWFNHMGDWNPNTSPGKFPGGAPDLVKFVAEIHRQGFKTALWWYPLGVDPESKVRKERPDLLVQDEKGGYPLDASKLHQLCPAHPPARARIREVLKTIIADWKFDGVYLDFGGLSSVGACFNQAHKHASPLDADRELPRMFEDISRDLHRMKKDPFLEACICGLPHSPYNMPYYHLANASDPVNLGQARRRIKVEKAIRGPTAAVGDCYQLPEDEWRGVSVQQSFEMAMGTGAQMTTFYKDLDEGQKAEWTRWFREYNELRLSSGDYLNLYDVAFDKPEAHVVRKGADLYYGFFATAWPRKRKVTLRGLDKSRRYDVYDYANRRELGEISGADPVLLVGFRESLLLRVRARP